MRSGTGRRAWRALLATAALAAVAVGPASPAFAGVKKPAAKCEAGGWIGVAGRPANLGALAPAGIYVWIEKGLWRVAVTHADRRVQVFQGTVSFDAAMSATPVGVEGRFDVVVPNKNSASFTFKNYGGIDSIAISAPCATTMSVTGTIDGTPIDASQIFLGPNGTNPVAVPATVTKGALPAVATTAAATATTVAATSGASTASTPPTVASAAAAAATAATANNCVATAWPAVTAGRPTIKARTASGLYLWSEKSGFWSVMVSGDPGPRAEFRGKITVVAPASTGGVVVAPSPADLSRDDVTVQGDSVLFNLKVGNGGREFVFYAPCASQITIEGAIDGVAMTAAQVFVGGSATPVPAMPYTVTR